MNDFEQKRKRYAELAVKVGIHLQPGQKLYISSPVVAYDFTRLIVEAAFQAGAADVYVEWNDDICRRERLQHVDEALLGTIPDWMLERRLSFAEEGAAFLSVLAENPEVMKDVPPKRISTLMVSLREKLQPAIEYTMSSRCSWSIVAIPTPQWAEKVFGEGPDAVEQLWDAIFRIVRIDREDPIAAWQEHLDNLKNRRTYLNENRIRRLHIESEGTDLYVDLPEKHHWQGGSKKNEVGTDFVANIPTEEVFTLPHKTGVNGTVRSTLPLHYLGSVIDGIELTFKDGAVIDYHAREGQESLKELLETDEGALHLGEIALVPYHSPISDMGLVFFNTLFDENASCHLAFGRAYPTSLQGGVDMTPEERLAHGANHSLVHVDFMIGGADTRITAEMADGTPVRLFDNGDWAL